MVKFDSSQAIAVTCRTDNELYKLGMGPYCLYHRYAYHSKIQKTNQIWTTNSFMAKDMNVSIATIKRYKKNLKDASFIEVVRTWDKNTLKLGKSYVKLNHLLGGFKTKIASKSIDSYGLTGEPVARGSLVLPVAQTSHKCLKDNKSKCFKDDNLQNPHNSMGKVNQMTPAEPDLDMTAESIMNKFRQVRESLHAEGKEFTKEVFIFETKNCMDYYGEKFTEGKLKVWLRKCNPRGGKIFGWTGGIVREI